MEDDLFSPVSPANCSTDNVDNGMFSADGIRSNHARQEIFLDQLVPLLPKL